PAAEMPMARPLPALRPGGVPGRHPAGGLRFVHTTIIAPGEPCLLSGRTLILPGRHQGRSGVFPIPARGRADHAGGMNTTTAEANSQATHRSGPLPLSRPVDDRMIAGVAAGIARYLGADVTVIRIILVVLAFVGGAGVPIYLAGWLLIPEEG